MTLPAGIAVVTVSGRLLNPDGSGASGAVDFIPSVRVLHAAEGVVMLPARYSAPLVAGVFTIVLPACDDGNPSGWTFVVKERVRAGAAPYSISVLLVNGATQDLSALAPVTSDTGVPVVVGPPGPIALTESPPGSGLFVALLSENPAGSGLFQIAA